MSVTVVIEQPNYIPWLGYFDLIRQSDVWVWYDDVQYTRRDWRNRNRVAGRATPEWLTIPVKTKGSFSQLISDVAIDDSEDWRRRHLGTLRRCYGAAPFFEIVHDVVGSAIGAGHERLADLTIALNEAICALLRLTPRFERSSRMNGEKSGRQERLIEICAGVGGTTYLSGPAARAYIDPWRFADAGIDLRYISYNYPQYPRGDAGFIANLSIVDALAWLGPDGTAAFLATHGHRSVAA
jgi:hypothetical protein